MTTVGALDDPDAAADTDGRPGIADVWLVAIQGGTGRPARSERVGAQMLVGYLHAEDEAESFDEDGYFRTGDLGRWDGDALVVTGRAKDIIIRNGENISPKEVEDILIGHPAIAEVAVVGLPDARTGERACAVIVARERTRSGRRSAARVPARTRRREVQSARAGGRLGCTAEERCRQGAEAPDPSDVGHSGRAKRWEMGRWSDMQVAIVTGASSGIGFGTAVKLAGTGMAVLGTGRDEARLAELSKAAVGCRYRRGPVRHSGRRPHRRRWSWRKSSTPP